MTDTLPPLPEPFDYCYEWDGPYGTRKFSPAQHNGNRPTRSVALYTADQMRAYAAAAVAAEREACAKDAGIVGLGLDGPLPALLWSDAMPDDVARWISAHPPKVVTQ